MKQPRWSVLLLLLCLLNLNAFAADDEDDDEVEGSLVAEAEKSSGFGGWLDLRPGYSFDARTAQSENEVALEYRFRADRAVGYTQEFRSNPAIAGEEIPSGQWNFRLWDGYFVGDIGNIVGSSTSPVSLSYEPRLYLPTSAHERPAGMVATTRQYLKLELHSTPSTTFFLYDAPILAWYSQRGFVGKDEEKYANRWFENRVELGVNFTFLREKLHVRLPLVLQSLRHSNYDEDAENNDKWSHVAWLYPEVMYQLTETTAVGMDFYTDSLMNEDFSATNFRDGFRRGAAHVVLQQAL